MLVGGCTPKRTDYGNYLRLMPKSILVLPPLNDSNEVMASDAFLSTITAPLAECGYYVFPIAIVDRILKEEGVPTPGEMHQVSPQKLGEVFGADAVLYITIKTWTTTYIVFDSTTTVVLDYKLIDADTGTQLWTRRGAMQYSSSQGQNNIIGMVVAAQIHAAMSASGRYELNCARALNQQVCANRMHGFLLGWRHPDYERDHARVLAAQEKLESQR